jgi:hypothetical protein
MPTASSISFLNRPLRGPILGLLFLALVAGVRAQNNAAGIVLPAGKELTRIYSAEQISVRVLSRPFFSASATGTPALEVGPVSLTFMRDKAGGAMLLLGDTPLNLPFTIALGEDGRSADPVDFVLSYNQPLHLAKVTLGKSVFAVEATAMAGPLGVVVTAGTEQTWSLDVLDVQAGTGVGAGGKNNAAGEASRIVPRAVNPKIFAANRAQDFDDSEALLRTGDLAGAEKALFRSNRWPEDTVGWRLESAGRLTQLALVLRQKYDYPDAIALAQRTLAILREIETVKPKAGARERTQAYEMAAYIAQELLRDPAAARVDYQQALTINNRSPRAVIGLKQLDREQEKAARLGSLTK